MAGDLQQVLAELIQQKLGQGNDGGEDKPSRRPLSGLKGVAAGAGVAAAAPLALKSLPKLLGKLGVDVEELISDPARGLGGLASNLGQGVGSSLGERLEGKIDDAGGPSGILKDTIKSALPFGGGDDDDDDGSGDGTPGVGKGRRMPVQQSVDIGVPLETVYNQFTQFELWPQFMHRVARLDQEDDCTLAFATKIWGKTKEFTVEIETQRPDERIKWHTTGGMTHVGVVTFHELGPNLTRVLVGMDLDPGGMLEKVARGMRFLKRAVRADLHRFKALIETSERETGAWRGTIENGEVTQPHDAKYDKQREYADPAALLSGDDAEESEQDQDSGGSAAASRGSSSRSASSKSPSKSSSSRSGSSQSRSKSASSRSGSSQSRSKSASSRSGSSQSRSKSSSSRSGSSQSASKSSSSRSSQSTPKKTASRSPSRQQRRTSSSDKPKASRSTSRRRGSTNGGSGSRSGSRGRNSGSNS